MVRGDCDRGTGQADQCRPGEALVSSVDRVLSHPVDRVRSPDARWNSNNIALSSEFNGGILLLARGIINHTSIAHFL